GTDCRHRPDRAWREPPYGGALMDPRRFRLGLLLAVAAIGVAFVASLAPGAVKLAARPGLWETTATAGVLFLIAAWLADARSVGPGLAGVVAAGTVSLVLLDDPTVAGEAGAGFWAIVIAVWLAAAMAVVQLAAIRPFRKARMRAINILVPLLFGATVFYLW